MSITSKVPDYLYRYRSLAGQQKDWVKDSILNSRHHFSSPKAFNDPFDCRPVFRLTGTKEEIVKYYEGAISRQAPQLSRQERRKEARSLICNPDSDPRIPENLIRMHGLYDQMVTARIGVLCLSETCSDILMWSHYADSHRGICLKFDAARNVFETSQAVRYSKLRPVINPLTQTQEEMLDHAVFTKSEHWAYEKEWRLIQYKHGAGLYRVPSKDLVGIILGSQISNPDKNEVLSWVKEVKKPLIVYQARVSGTKFEIEIDELRI